MVIQMNKLKYLHNQIILLIPFFNQKQLLIILT